MGSHRENPQKSKGSQKDHVYGDLCCVLRALRWPADRGEMDNKGQDLGERGRCVPL